MKTVHFGLFSAQEESLYNLFRAFRDKTVQPIAELLHRLGVTADQVSLFGFLMILPVLMFLNSNFILALVFILLHLGLDVVDGALARLSGTSGRKGAFTDHVLDYAFFMILLFGLMFFRFTSPFIGGFYVANYLVALGFSVILSNLKSDRLLYIFKSRMVVLLTYAIFCLFGINYLDIVLMFFAVYLFAMNLLLFYRIRCSL